MKMNNRDNGTGKQQSRRDFLKALCTAGLTPTVLGGLNMLVPHPALAATLAQGPRWDRYVIVIHLVGGNDGLNTLVPYREETYYKARPDLAIDADQVLKISDTLGLNPVMEPLLPSWQAHDLAFVQNVGYPHVIRSHLASMQIWNTGSEAGQTLQDGWMGRLFSHADHAMLDLDGIAIGMRNKGIMKGDDMRVFRMDGVDAVNHLDFVLNHPEEAAPNDGSAMDYLLDMYAATANAGNMFKGIEDVDIPNSDDFPKFSIGGNLLQAAQVIKKGLKVPVIVTGQNGYDNHVEQRELHTEGLERLSQALAAFRRAMIDMGKWDKVLIMTNSEFGRRVAENANKGTDHGNAAPHMLMGGRVRGGLYGPDPDLEYLDERGDIEYTTHFHRLFATAAAWWNLPDSARSAVFGEHKPLNCLNL